MCNQQLLQANFLAYSNTLGQYTGIVAEYRNVLNSKGKVA